MRLVSYIKSLDTLVLNEKEFGNRVTYSNIVYLTLPVVYVFFMAIDYETFIQSPLKWKFDQLTVPLMIIICFVCLWLNKVGWYFISRIVFLVLWPILLHIVPIILLQTPTDYYLALPVGIIFHTLIAQLLISNHQNPWLFWFFIVVDFLFLISTPFILSHFDVDADKIVGLIEDRYFLLDAILYWLLFNLVTFYLLYKLEGYIHQLKISNVFIEKQRIALDELNKGLEATVLQRTADLEQQNEKLRDYAHYNAHLLRGPFCRVQGLIMLQGLTKSTEEQEKINELLKQSMLELNSRIEEIQRIVDEP
jgi:signal transduction histidine kinase